MSNLPDVDVFDQLLNQFQVLIAYPKIYMYNTYVFTHKRNIMCTKFHANPLRYFSAQLCIPEMFSAHTQQTELGQKYVHTVQMTTHQKPSQLVFEM